MSTSLKKMIAHFDVFTELEKSLDLLRWMSNPFEDFHRLWKQLCIVRPWNTVGLELLSRFSFTYMPSLQIAAENSSRLAKFK